MAETADTTYLLDRMHELGSRQDAQGRRLDSAEAAHVENRQKLESLDVSIDDLTLELTKATVTMQLMIKAFNGAKIAAYGVIGTVVAAAVIVALGLR